MIKKLAVFCGARPGEDPRYLAQARTLGRQLAANQIELVYGGGGYGLMGALANAVLDNGGQVTGVITAELAARGAGLPRLARQLVLPNMDRRKEKMMQLADGFLALPGGLGTLEEISQVCSWITIGDNQKPVAIYNYNHFYDELGHLMEKMNQQAFLEGEYLQSILFSTDLNQILTFMKDYRAPASRSYSVN